MTDRGFENARDILKALTWNKLSQFQRQVFPQKTTDIKPWKSTAVKRTVGFGGDPL
jgi:hypothetical protein